jgi:4-amino-4-deoxychorismate lyase
MSGSLLIETIRIEDGKIFYIEYHNQRFNRSREELFGVGKHFDLSTILTPPPIGVYRCRVLYSDTIKSVEYMPYSPKDIKSIKVIKSDIEYNYKYANREELNLLLDNSSDEILIIKDNLATDTSIANIAFWDRDRWITPKTPLLAGTTRQRLIDSGFLTQKNIKIDEIYQFNIVSLMNAMVGFRIITPNWIKA